MSSKVEEAAETQQLMQDGDEEEIKIHSQLAISPVTSNKMSSGAASNASKTPGHLFTSGSNSINDHSKISYLNERRAHRDLARSNYNNRPRNLHKEAPDVKHMEKALLELLNDFHTGKLSAFGAGCSMEQMMDIRDQQEHLARLHFRLGADKPVDDKDLSNCTSSSRDSMSQLVQSLEQLSASIEHLHSGDATSSTK